MRLDSGWDEAEGAVESLQFEVTSACREVRNSSRSSGQLAACSPLPAKEQAMAYRIAGIDAHKKKLAVVVADVEVHDEYQFDDAGSEATRSSCNGWRSG